MMVLSSIRLLNAVFEIATLLMNRIVCVKYKDFENVVCLIKVSRKCCQEKIEAESVKSEHLN